MRALTISTSTSRRTDMAEEAGEAEVDEEEEDVPVLINPELPNLKTVLDAADAVVEVLDARDPAAARSTHLEELVRGGGKKLLLVLTKVGGYTIILRYSPPPLLRLCLRLCMRGAHLSVVCRYVPEGSSRGVGGHPAQAAPHRAVPLCERVSARLHYGHCLGTGQEQGQGARAC